MKRLLLFVCVLLAVALPARAAGADTAGSPPAIRLPDASFDTALARAVRFFDGFTWAGDVRVRYEGVFDDTTGVSDRERGRYSLRLGFTKVINSRVVAGVRLATGTAASPSSTFQSFDNAATGKVISIDRAYIDLVPFGSAADVHLILGKQDVPFIGSTLAWDKDVGLEGVSETARMTRGPWKLWAAAGQYFFEDNAAPDDPYMLAEQVGFDHVLNADRGWKWGAAAGLYHAIRPFGIDATTQSATNTAAARHLPNDPTGFSVLDIHGYFETRIGRATPLRFNGAWIRNLSATWNSLTNSVADEGWLAEAVLSKITEAGTWEIGGGWRCVEADATLAQFTESEFSTSAGNTDLEGWFARATYSPWRNVTLGVSGFHTAPASLRRISERGRIETTIGVKF